MVEFGPQPILLEQLGVNKQSVDTVAAQLQSDSRALRHDLKLHGDFRRKALARRLAFSESTNV